MEACDFLFILLVSVFNFPFLSASSFWSRILHSLNSARSSGYSPNFVFINGSISGTFDSSLIIWIQNLFLFANKYITSGCIQQVAACSGVQPSRSWIFTETPFIGQNTTFFKGIIFLSTFYMSSSPGDTCNTETLLAPVSQCLQGNSRCSDTSLDRIK